jgi:DNA-binding transcriptional MerR regulator
LTFIRRCPELGFPQAAVREMLELTQHPDLSCEAVTRIARAQVEDVELRIARLSSLKSGLYRVIKSCSGERIENCKIIEALPMKVRTDSSEIDGCCADNANVRYGSCVDGHTPLLSHSKTNLLTLVLSLVA